MTRIEVWLWAIENSGPKILLRFLKSFSLLFVTNEVLRETRFLHYYVHNELPILGHLDLPIRIPFNGFLRPLERSFRTNSGQVSNWCFEAQSLNSTSDWLASIWKPFFSELEGLNPCLFGSIARRNRNTPGRFEWIDEQLVDFSNHPWLTLRFTVWTFRGHWWVRGHKRSDSHL